MPGNTRKIGREGSLRRLQQQPNQRWLPDVVSFRDECLWVAFLFCMQLFYQSSNISAEPEAIPSLCSLKPCMAWGGLFSKNTFLCFIFSCSCKSNAAWRKQHNRHSPGQTQEPWQHTQCISESCGHLGRGGQYCELITTASLTCGSVGDLESQAATQFCWVLV